MILSTGSGLLYWIYTTEPEARQEGAEKTTAMLVDVVTVDTGTYRPRIEAMGTVEPTQDIILRPRVGGEVMDRSRNFTPGGFVEKGDTLVRLDPSDYRNMLEQRKSELRQARSDLRIEMGRQDVAREEYELLEEKLSEENRALVLRKPQLESARAQVESARAAVDQAELELDRTSIGAPFDAQVLRRSVNVGSQVSVGDELARLVGMDTYWVEVTVPLSDLRWLDVPDTPGAKGPPVRIRNESAWGSDEHRRGHLDKVVGELEDQARMARVLVTVEDPLLRKDTDVNSPQMLVGSFVETSIRGKKIKNVVRLNRDFLREDDTVWVMKDGELDIREVQVAFRDADYAYIAEGLSPGERVVTTNLATVVEGTALRLKKDPDNSTSSDRESEI